MSVTEIVASSPQAVTSGDADNADNVQTRIVPGNPGNIAAVIRCYKCRALSNYVIPAALAELVAEFVQYRCGSCGKCNGGRVIEWRDSVAGDPPLYGAPRLAVRGKR